MAFVDYVSVGAGLCVIGHFTYNVVWWCFNEKDKFYDELEKGILT